MAVSESLLTGRDDQQRPAVVRPNVELGAGFEQKAGLVSIVDGQHQRSAASVACGIRIGARFEQPSHRIDVPGWTSRPKSTFAGAWAKA